MSAAKSTTLRKGMRVRSCMAVGICTVWLFSAAPRLHARAQQPEPAGSVAPSGGQAAGADAEQDEQAKPPSSNTDDNTKKKDDRIFGIMPNFATVEGASDIEPLTWRQKFKITAQGVFDPYEFVIVGIVAGVNQAENTDASLGQGAAGYGKRYAVDFANQAISNFMTGAIFPSILREDPRYFQLGKGSFRHRFVYAFSRILITRRDSGGRQFNYSEFVGNGVAAGLSNVYSGPHNASFSDTASTFGEQLLIDGLGNELKEFWPDIDQRFFKHLKLRF